MIGKYYYMNLESRIDKHYAQQAVCCLRGVPGKILERIPAAIENENCPDTVQELGQMIVDDGFPEWAFYTQLPSDTTYRSHWLASDWTKLRALRDIAFNKEVAVLSSDAWFLKIGFDSLDLIASNLPSLKVLHLQHLPVIGWRIEPDQYADYKGITSRMDLTGAGARIFTPAGAAEQLDVWSQMPNVAAQDLAYEASNQHGRIDGWWCCNPSVMELLDSETPDYQIVRKDKWTDPPV